MSRYNLPLTVRRITSPGTRAGAVCLRVAARTGMPEDLRAPFGVVRGLRDARVPERAGGVLSRRQERGATLAAPQPVVTP